MRKMRFLFFISFVRLAHSMQIVPTPSADNCTSSNDLKPIVLDQTFSSKYKNYYLLVSLLGDRWRKILDRPYSHQYKLKGELSVSLSDSDPIQLETFRELAREKFAHRRKFYISTVLSNVFMNIPSNWFDWIRKDGEILKSNVQKFHLFDLDVIAKWICEEGKATDPLNNMSIDFIKVWGLRNFSESFVYSPVKSEYLLRELKEHYELLASQFYILSSKRSLLSCELEELRKIAEELSQQLVVAGACSKAHRWLSYYITKIRPDPSMGLDKLMFHSDYSVMTKNFDLFLDSIRRGIDAEDEESDED